MTLVFRSLCTHDPGGVGVGVGSAGVGSCSGSAGAGAVFGSSCAPNLDVLRTDDVIPTPLEITSPGGAGDILSMACLGSYRPVSSFCRVSSSFAQSGYSPFIVFFR